MILDEIVENKRKEVGKGNKRVVERRDAMRRKTVFSILMLMSFFGFLSGAVAGTSDTKQAASPVDVVRGVETTGIDLSLRLGGSICGHVYQADGATPIARTVVDVYDSSWGYVWWAFTDDDGFYSLGGLGSGDYYVRAGEEWFLHPSGWLGVWETRYYDDSRTREGATPVAVTEGTDAKEIDFCLPPASPGRTGSISGHVYGAGFMSPPLEWIGVHAHSLDGSFAGEARTDADGYYVIEHLPAGPYLVSAWERGAEWLWSYSPQYYDRAESEDQATAVEVTADTDTGAIDFYLEWLPFGGSISGDVYGADGGAPLASIEVSLADASGYEGKIMWTNDDGSYDSGLIRPGDYVLHAGRGSEYVRRYYRDSATREGARRVSVTAGGEAAGIDFSLPLGASVSGRIYEAPGDAPVSGWTPVRAYDMEWVYVAYGHTDAEGHYRIGGLDTGGYYLEAGEGSKYLPGYYSARADLRMRAPSASTRGVVLRWTSEEGRSYKVAVSPDLLSWHELAVTISGASGQAVTEWCDSEAASFPRGFYKVKQLD